MPSFEPEPFDNWSDAEQEQWLDMVESSGHSELNDDAALMAFYDIAFNTPRGEMSGDDRAAVMEGLFDYIRDVYDFDFSDHFDWEAWREMYGTD